MKNGIYKVSIGFQFENFETEEEALNNLIDVLTKMKDEEESVNIDAEFELVEEFDTDYTEEEEEIEELNFDEAA